MKKHITKLVGQAPTAVALQRLVRRLRRVSKMMRQVGADMEYHGGFGEIGEHGRCMVGASQMAKSWADGIAYTLEIKRNISYRVKTPNGEVCDGGRKTSELKP